MITPKKRSTSIEFGATAKTGRITAAFRETNLAYVVDPHKPEGKRVEEIKLPTRLKGTGNSSDERPCSSRHGPRRKLDDVECNPRNDMTDTVGGFRKECAGGIEDPFLATARVELVLIGDFGQRRHHADVDDRAAGRRHTAETDDEHDQRPRAIGGRKIE